MSKFIALILFCIAAYCSVNMSISGYVFLLAWLGFMAALYFVLEPDDAKRFWNGK